MGLQTGRHTCGVPSVSWCASLALFILLNTLLAAGQSAPPANVHDCHPCTFSPGPDVPTYNFTFELKTTGNERLVQAIQVASQDPKTMQRLSVTGMDTIGLEDNFFFGGVDINFDGFLDLMLITRRGVANAYAAYWIFDHSTGKFTPLGTYPVFRLVSEQKRLETYERGGSGGMIYTSKQFAFIDGKLTLMRDEKQTATKQADVFLKVVRKRVNGTMKAINTEKVPAPK